MEGSDKEAVRLKQQLDTLLEEARINEAKLRRLQEYELCLLASDSLQELVSLLLDAYPKDFQLHSASLLLIDPEYEIARMLEDEETEPPVGLRLIDDARSFTSLMPEVALPYLGTYDADQMAEVIQHSLPEHGSMAMMPLLRHQQCIGGLCLFSADEQRFNAEQATDFLSRFCIIVAACLENVINHHRLKQIGLTDALTGLSNRRYFDKRLHEEITRALRHDTPLCCLFVDADDFKQINDRFGHHEGDRVLQAISKVLREHVRAQDVLARLGGEEFAVLLSESDVATAEQVAERMREAIAALSQEAGPRISVSIGISELHDVAGHLRDIEEMGQALMEKADQALYAAKQGGKNRVVS